MEFVAYARKIPPKAQVLLSLIDVVAEECLQRLRPTGTRISLHERRKRRENDNDNVLREPLGLDCSTHATELTGCLLTLHCAKTR